MVSLVFIDDTFNDHKLNVWKQRRWNGIEDHWAYTPTEISRREAYDADPLAYRWIERLAFSFAVRSMMGDPFYGKSIGYWLLELKEKGEKV